MTALNRREFLHRSKRTSLGLAAGVTILGNAVSVRAAPANEKIVMAMMGVKTRGRALAREMNAQPGVEIGYMAEVDQGLFEPCAQYIAEGQDGKAPKCVVDFREALDDKSVDVLLCAAPEHWHALATVWACQAGKDVYVEKPASHSCWEGQKMVQAARKYKRIVQTGTQNRSAPYCIAAKKYIDEGKLGKVHLCRVFNQQLMPNFPATHDSDPPKGLDWDLWNGPAPEHKYNRAMHQNWRHFWQYSGGDIANGGVHQLDIARWLCGVGVPKQVYCSGGRYNTQGAAESPDTQVATYTFDNMLMTFELTLYTPYMIKSDGALCQGDIFPHWPQNSCRVEIFGSKGLMYVGRHGTGWQVYVRPKSRKPVVKQQMYGRWPNRLHAENFVACLRSRQTPNADVLEGHRSALLVHYANISTRIGGQTLVIDPKTEQIVDNDKAMTLFKRSYRKPYVIDEEV